MTKFRCRNQNSHSGFEILIGFPKSKFPISTAKSIFGKLETTKFLRNYDKISSEFQFLRKKKLYWKPYLLISYVYESILFEAVASATRPLSRSWMTSALISSGAHSLEHRYIRITVFYMDIFEVIRDLSMWNKFTWAQFLSTLISLGPRSTSA
jgi:hypothetical protein